MRITFGRRFFVALTVVLITGLIFRVSYFQQNAEAYLFPSIVASAVLLFSLIALAREAFDLCVDDFQPFPFMRQLPVIVMMIVAVSVIELIGMYSTAFITLCAVSIWYSPEPEWSRTMLRGITFSAGFTLFMYLLFTLLLNVQLPRGLWI